MDGAPTTTSRCVAGDRRVLLRKPPRRKRKRPERRPPRRKERAKLETKKNFCNYCNQLEDFKYVNIYIYIHDYVGYKTWTLKNKDSSKTLVGGKDQQNTQIVGFKNKNNGRLQTDSFFKVYTKSKNVFFSLNRQPKRPKRQRFLSFVTTTKVVVPWRFRSVGDVSLILFFKLNVLFLMQGHGFGGAVYVYWTC